MKECGGVDVFIYVFLTSALVRSESAVSRPCRFTTEERLHGTHWIGVWVDLRAGVDNVEKWQFLSLSGLELRHLGRPARSQSLYRLRYAAHNNNKNCIYLFTYLLLHFIRAVVIRYLYTSHFMYLCFFPNWKASIHARSLNFFNLYRKILEL
jgi:hypothetical protein